MTFYDIRISPVHPARPRPRAHGLDAIDDGHPTSLLPGAFSPPQELARTRPIAAVRYSRRFFIGNVAPGSAFDSGHTYLVRDAKRFSLDGGRRARIVSLPPSSAPAGQTGKAPAPHTTVAAEGGSTQKRARGLIEVHQSTVEISQLVSTDPRQLPSQLHLHLEVVQQSPTAMATAWSD